MTAAPMQFADQALNSRALFGKEAAKSLFAKSAKPPLSSPESLCLWLVQHRNWKRKSDPSFNLKCRARELRVMHAVELNESREVVQTAVAAYAPVRGPVDALEERLLSKEKEVASRELGGASLGRGAIKHQSSQAEQALVNARSELETLRAQLAAKVEVRTLFASA